MTINRIFVSNIIMCSYYYIICITKSMPSLGRGLPVCLDSFITKWQYQGRLISERALFSRRFPGFAHLFFCQEQIIGEKPDPVTLSNTNTTRPGTVSNPVFRGQRLVSYHLDHGTALKSQSVPRSKHTPSLLYKPLSQCCIGK